MSTKIYNGYKINCNINELMKRLLKFKNKCENYLNEEYIGHFFRLQISKLDNYHLGDSEQKPFFFNDTILEIDDEINKAVNGVEAGNIFNMYDYSVSIFPFENYFLALLYSYDKNIDKYFLEEVEPDDFSYWDNTDPPEEISWEDFDKRGEIWNTVFGGDGYSTPSESGLSFCPKLYKKYGSIIYNRKELEKYFKLNLDKGIFLKKNRIMIRAKEFIRLQCLKTKECSKNNFWDWEKIHEEYYKILESDDWDSIRLIDENGKTIKDLLRECEEKLIEIESFDDYIKEMTSN